MSGSSSTIKMRAVIGTYNNRSAEGAQQSSPRNLHDGRLAFTAR
jgi:hypothetical protein